MTAAIPSPPIVTQLRRRHHDLAQRGLSTPIGAEERQSFIAELIAAGGSIAPGRDRDAVRKFLYFWVADAVGRGDRPKDQPIPSLDPYNDGGSTAPSDAAEVADAAPPPGMVETAGDPRAALRIATLARQWRISNGAEGYLLSGDALKEAAQFTDNADISALVQASEVGQARKSRRRLWIVSIASMLFALSVGYLYFEQWQANRELKKVIEELNHVNEALNRAIAERTDALDELRASGRRESQRTRDEARSAMDALRRGKATPNDDPLKPLKDLLIRIGDAQEHELARLDYKPPDPAAIPLGDRVVDSDPRPAAADRPESIGSCEGALWLGSDGAKLINVDVKLMDLEGNETVTVKETANIRLRRTMPPQSYVMTEQIGIVPGGAVVTLTGEPRPYPRPNGIQFFAPVRAPYQYCSRVFIQYDGPPDKATALRKGLAELGVQVPAAQDINKAPRQPEVRYFWEKDAGVAKLVADRMRGLLDNREVQLRPLLTFPTKPSTGTLEVWVDLTP